MRKEYSREHEHKGDTAEYSHETGGQAAVYNLEHYGAWLFAIVAIALGALGLLEGLGATDIVEVGDVNLEESEQPVQGATGSFYDGLLFLLPGIAAAILAYCLHNTDHHRTADLSVMPASEKGLWSFEHTAAYLFAIGTIALGTLTLLVGFEAFDSNNPQEQGVLIGLAAIGGAVLTSTVHQVRHHQLYADEDFIVNVVERRVGSMGTAQTTGRGETRREVERDTGSYR